MRDRLAARPSVAVVVQEPQLGTGHALLQAEQALAGRRGTLVVLSGDVPLLRPGTLERLVDTHTAKRRRRDRSDGDCGRPHRLRPYRPGGRRHRCRSSSIGTPRAEVRRIREINSGIYAFDLEPLFAALRIHRLRRTRRASTTCRTSSASIASAGSGSRRWCWTIPRRFSASTAAASWRSSRRACAIGRTTS